jgi:hypothetical protein
MRVHHVAAAAACLSVFVVGVQPAMAAQGPVALVRPPQSQPGFATAAPMTYHGGLVQLTTKTYVIFWRPPTLQSGAKATYAKGYTSLVKQYLSDIGGSGWYNIATQYSQTVSSSISFITNSSRLGGAYTDNTTPYPVGECSAPDTGTNCLLNSDIRAEVSRAIAAEGWKPNKITQFLVLTAKDEGSCWDSTHTDCAFRDYCAYHSWYTLNGARVVYSNMPYLVNTKYTCAVGGQPSPNANKPADYEINLLSHEVMESLTDPGLDAWYQNSTSGEIGDLCAWNFGTAGLDGGLANEAMNGHFYYTQMEWSNDGLQCRQTYP